MGISDISDISDTDQIKNIVSNPPEEMQHNLGLGERLVLGFSTPALDYFLNQEGIYAK